MYEADALLDELQEETTSHPDDDVDMEDKPARTLDIDDAEEDAEDEAVSAADAEAESDLDTAGADLLVSLPKLKTHHWAGVTLSLKNMFGIIPGGVYGWPKNALHMAGIGNSILDINATLARMDRFTIVDGIVGMDGNGPIQGEPRPAGVMVMGVDHVAVDAACCRLMNIAPERVDYLRRASMFLGNLTADRIDQRAEHVSSHETVFLLIDDFAWLRAVPASSPG